jgi:hypothetical protein
MTSFATGAETLTGASARNRLPRSIQYSVTTQACVQFRPKSRRRLASGKL